MTANTEHPPAAPERVLSALDTQPIPARALSELRRSAHRTRITLPAPEAVASAALADVATAHSDGRVTVPDIGLTSLRHAFWSADDRRRVALACGIAFVLACAIAVLTL